MNEKNRSFMNIIGVYFLLCAVVMSLTGYWPSLQAFRVSERFFHFLTICNYLLGGSALAIALIARELERLAGEGQAADAGHRESIPGKGMKGP